MKNYAVVAEVSREDYYRASYGIRNESNNIVVKGLDQIDGRYFVRATIFGTALLKLATEQARAIKGFVVMTECVDYASSQDIINALKANAIVEGCDFRKSGTQLIASRA